jgi:hypothetical protein
VVDDCFRALDTDGSALITRKAIDLVLDGEQLVDAHGLDRGGGAFWLYQLEQLAPPMGHHPASVVRLG